MTIGYKATFNTNTGGKKSLFMKKNGIAAAYRWIPWLSRQQKFSTPNFGESWVTGTSPRVTVTLHLRRRPHLRHGQKRTNVDGDSQTFKAHNVRDFNFAASPDYKIKKTTWNGIRLRVLYKVSNPNALMSWSLRPSNASATRSAYPYDHLDVAETPAGTGMESPGMTWVDATLTSRASHASWSTRCRTSGSTAASETTGSWQPFLDEATSNCLTRDLLGSFRQPICAKARLDLRVWDYSSPMLQRGHLRAGRAVPAELSEQGWGQQVLGRHAQLLPEAKVRDR